MDLDKIRQDTPGAAHRAYLQNAGAALSPQPIIDIQKDHLDLEATIGGYDAAIQENAKIEAMYCSTAKLINASPAEIAFVTNATDGWQKAFYSYALTLEPGDRILVAKAEYAANYVAFLQVAKRTGIAIDVVPNDATGQLDVNALDRMITSKSKLIAITWLPTNGGLVNPAAEVGKIARQYEIPYLLDACQAVGQMPVNVEELGCDMLAATGRKFLRGPRGTGFLYVRQATMAWLEPAMIDHYGAPWVAPDEYKLRPDARRFELWEKNYAALLGFGAAVDYALEIGIEPIAERCRLLANHLRDGLKEIPGVHIHDLGLNPSAIVSFSIDGQDAPYVKTTALEKGIVIGVSQPTSTMLDSKERKLSAIVRASPHYYNSVDDINRLVNHCLELAPRRALNASVRKDVSPP